ncbi:MAG: hypothetical protein M1318_00330, partial [Firmicutes bacterium]|nr:hypothetical protein [Bacillota bacterium]
RRGEGLVILWADWPYFHASSLLHGGQSRNRETLMNAWQEPATPAPDLSGVANALWRPWDVNPSDYSWHSLIPGFPLSLAFCTSTPQSNIGVPYHSGPCPGFLQPVRWITPCRSIPGSSRSRKAMAGLFGSMPTSGDPS